MGEISTQEMVSLFLTRETFNKLQGNGGTIHILGSVIVVIKSNVQ